MVLASWKWLGWQDLNLHLEELTLNARPFRQPCVEVAGRGQSLSTRFALHLPVLVQPKYSDLNATPLKRLRFGLRRKETPLTPLWGCGGLVIGSRRILSYPQFRPVNAMGSAPGTEFSPLFRFLAEREV